MDIKFSANRSDAIRTILEARAVTDGGAPWLRRQHRWLIASALVVSGALGGTGFSAAAFAIAASSHDHVDVSSADGGVVAPPGVIPGQPIISLLGDPVSQQTSGDTEIPLVDVPPAATHVRVTVVCLTAGTTSWGFDTSGNNPSSRCDDADVSSPSAGAWLDFALSSSTTTLLVRSSPETRAVITYQFLNYVPTALAVNDRGETYGAPYGGGPEPDLVAVTGTSANGDQVDGYARASELNAFGPDRPGQPSNPAEALKWQKERDAKYPNGWDIPVYESDGTTEIGTFHIG